MADRPTGRMRHFGKQPRARNRSGPAFRTIPLHPQDSTQSRRYSAFTSVTSVRSHVTDGSSVNPVQV